MPDLTLTPNLGVMLVATNAVQKETVINEALITFDALVARVAIGFGATPPANPNDGDTYIVGATPTGDFTGYTNAIAFYYNGWHFVTPPNQLKFYVTSAGAWYTYNTASTSWTADAVTVVNALTDLNDVAAADPADGQVLFWSKASGKWMPETINLVTALAQLTDVRETGVTNGDALVWNATDAMWEPTALSSLGGVTELEQLSDVDMSNAEQGYVLYWDAGTRKARWEALPSYPSMGVEQLNDVTIKTPQPNDALVWNGSGWGNGSIAFSCTFQNITNGPGSFGGAAGKMLICDPTESELIWSLQPAAITIDTSATLASNSESEVPSTSAVIAYVQSYVTASDYTDGKAIAAVYSVLDSLNGILTISEVDGKIQFAINCNTDGALGDDSDTELPSQKAVKTYVDTRFSEVLPALGTAGQVLTVNAKANGIGWVTPTSGGGSGSGGSSTLAGLTDVDMSTPPTEGQALVFDTSSAKWKPALIEGGGGTSSGSPPVDGYPVEVPVLSQFTWENQGAATAVQSSTNAPISLIAPATGNDDLKCLGQPVPPATPWTLTVKLHSLVYSVSYYVVGIYIRDSNGQIITLNSTSYSNVQYDHWHSYTSFNYTPYAVNSTDTATLWYRLVNDGTNYYAYISNNGSQWSLFYSEPVNTFLGTPVTAGVFADINAGTSYPNAIIDIWSFELAEGAGTNSEWGSGNGDGAGGTTIEWSVWFNGTPSPSELLALRVAARPFTLALNFEGAVASPPAIPPAVSFVMNVNYCPAGGSFTSVGTITVASDGSTVLATTFTSPLTVMAGDRLSITGPAIPDTQIAGYAVTLLGTLV